MCRFIDCASPASDNVNPTFRGITGIILCCSSKFCSGTITEPLSGSAEKRNGRSNLKTVCSPSATRRVTVPARDFQPARVPDECASAVGKSASSQGFCAPSFRLLTVTPEKRAEVENVCRVSAKARTDESTEVWYPLNKTFVRRNPLSSVNSGARRKASMLADSTLKPGPPSSRTTRTVFRPFTHVIVPVALPIFSGESLSVRRLRTCIESESPPAAASKSRTRLLTSADAANCK